MTNNTTHLRRLAVYVDEPDINQFYWVIIESIEDAVIWENLKAGEVCFSSWLAAWETGNKELLKMVADKKAGPLAPGEDKNADPVGGMRIAD